MHSLIVKTTTLALLAGFSVGLAHVPPHVEDAGLGLETTQLDLPGAHVGADVDTPVGNASVGITVDPDLEVPGLLGIGSHATFHFEPALYERAVERFRFVDVDGRPVDAITIQVAWHDGLGEPKDFPEGDAPRAILELVTRGKILSLEPDHFVSGHEAVFTIDYAHLVRGTSTDWTIRALASNEALRTDVVSVGVYSMYNRHGESNSAVEAALDDALDAVATPVRVVDADLDGQPNDRDNCPQTSNPDQANLDGDMRGDACDPDMDDDGHANTAEAEARSDPRDPRSTPDDPDADGFDNAGEAAAGSDPHNAASTPHDPDADGWNNDEESAAGSDPHNAASTPHDPDADGWNNDFDNCDDVSNTDQNDVDEDHIGDACDADANDGPAGDADGDGFLNRDDNCPRLPNDQSNMDGDARGDACDKDRDGDGHHNARDVFPDDPNEWEDHDGDGIGSNADPDDDNDGLSDEAEAASGTHPHDPDTDRDRLSDLDELQLGSDPNDAQDPPYHAVDVTVVGRDDGSSRIQWTGSGDARVADYMVWARTDLRLVATLPSEGRGLHEVIDRAHDGTDAMYSVQARFHDEPARFDLARSTTAVLLAADVVSWNLEAPGGDADQSQQPADPVAGPTDRVPGDLEPSRDAPGPGMALLVPGMLVAYMIARRQA